MNDKLVELMFYSSGLPASAMVAHACLEEDLGLDKPAMAGLVNSINQELKVVIPEQVWSAFARAGEIDHYLKNVRNGDDNE